MSPRFLLDALRLCLNPVASRRIDPVWLARHTSKIYGDYKSHAQVSVADDGENQIVTVNGTPFVWPRSAPVEDLLRITAELELPDHPHQYLYGHTQISPGDIVLDIGACEGGFSAMAAGRGATPIAVEPSPKMRQVIRRLFQIRNLPEPRMVADALSDTPGSGFFADDGIDVLSSRLAVNSANPSPGYKVRIRTLDDLVQELNLSKLDFIKCDAEGADVRILRGAVRTLARFKPKLALCIYHDASDFKQMRAILKPLGYHLKAKGIMNHGNHAGGIMLHAW